MLIIKGRIEKIKKNLDNKKSTPEGYTILVSGDCDDPLWVSAFGECPYQEGDDVILRIKINEFKGKRYFNIIETLEDPVTKGAQEKFNIVEVGNLSNKDWRLFELSSKSAEAYLLMQSLKKPITSLESFEKEYKEMTKRFIKWNQELILQ